MSLKPLPTIEIDCRLPLAVRLATFLACLAATLIPFVLSPTLAGLTVTLALATVVAFTALRSRFVGGPRAVQQAGLSADGTWWLKDAMGVTSSARLLGDSRVFAHWVWLRWEAQGGRRQTLLLKRGAQADAVRRLAVRLRLQGALRAASPDHGRL